MNKCVSRFVLKVLKYFSHNVKYSLFHTLWTLRSSVHVKL